LEKDIEYMKDSRKERIWMFQVRKKETNFFERYLKARFFYTFKNYKRDIFNMLTSFIFFDRLRKRVKEGYYVRI